MGYHEVELIQGRIRGRDKWAKPPPLKKSLLRFPGVIKRSLGLNPSGKSWLTPPPGQIPVYATELIHGRVCLKRQRFSVPSRLQNTDAAFFLQGGQKHFYKKSWIYEIIEFLDVNISFWRLLFGFLLKNNIFYFEHFYFSSVILLEYPRHESQIWFHITEHPSRRTDRQTDM